MCFPSWPAPSEPFPQGRRRWEDCQSVYGPSFGTRLEVLEERAVPGEVPACEQARRLLRSRRAGSRCGKASLDDQNASPNPIRFPVPDHRLALAGLTRTGDSPATSTSRDVKIKRREGGATIVEPDGGTESSTSSAAATYPLRPDHRRAGPPSDPSGGCGISTTGR